MGLIGIKKKQHVMIDFETLGTNCDSVILSFGAVPFNMDGTTNTGFEFYPDVQSQLENRKVSWSSVEWWFNQNDAVRRDQAEAQRLFPLEYWLESFSNWCQENLEDKFKIWSNGAAMDIALLRHAMIQHNIKIPWSHKCEYDTRTMVYMSKISVNKYDTGETKHNALNDCNWQISWLVDAYKILRGDY